MTPHGLPSELYHCLLDEQPYYLAPPRLLQYPELFDPVIVNPSCWFSWHGPLPPDKADRIVFTDAFLPSETIIWVEDPGTLAIWPYWVGPEYVEYLARMTPGEPVAEHLPPHVRWVLTQAEILVRANHLRHRQKQWHDLLLGYAESYQAGYVNIPDLIHGFHLGALRRYSRYKTRTGFYSVGDEQVSRRLAAHNEIVARYFHHQLTNAVSHVARAVLKPSYTYFVSYLSGAVLTKHVDREQSDYGITMCLDASPEPEDTSPWPIAFETSEGEVKIYQRVGDATLYRGCALPHYRDRLEPGLTSTSMLFFYVDDSFRGKLE